MTDNSPSAAPAERPEDARMPVLQELYDNPWFIFMVSLGIVLVSYIIWGLIDLLSIPTIP
jgi:hypothetical protein